ncbi:MraY family glycosyltransferase [Spiribacter sp. 221]|uniref:MraY family glycosyltransferase n=1 Tax=Spiribacter onubensis TaxID=3122420 RepID=UPI00349FCADF
MICLTAIRSLWPFAARLRLVDHPGRRRRQGDPAVVIGGLAITAALIAASLLFGPRYSVSASLAAGLALIACVGALDDALDLGYGPKFIAQLVAAALAIGHGQMALTDLGSVDALLPVSVESIAVPLTLLALVGFMNAMNFLDGVDGLSAGAATIMLGYLALAAAEAGTLGALALAGVTIAALAAFLLFNFPLPGRAQARVFLGDSGSLTLGLIIAWVAIDVSQAPTRTIAPVVIAWILAVPVTEVVAITLRRLFTGRHPFRADRTHLHHILLRAGFSRTAVTYLILTWVATLGAIGWWSAATGVSEIALLYTLGVATSPHALMVLFPNRAIRLAGRIRTRVRGLWTPRRRRVNAAQPPPKPGSRR